MRFSAAALVLVVASLHGSSKEDGSGSAVSAFTLNPSMTHSRRSCSSSQQQQQHSKSHSHSQLNLVETSGGMEELNDMLETSEQYNSLLSKQVRKSPSLWKLAGYASIPIGAALGFGLVPSRRLAAHAAGALVTGVAGAVGKSRLDAVTEANAKPALMQALVDAGLDSGVDVAQQAVAQVQADFGILDEDFSLLCTDIYASYLVGMVKFNPMARTSELKELETVQQALSLSSLQVGDAHCTAAKDLYRTITTQTSEEELEDADSTHPDRMAMDKFLFLTERSLAGETREAFTFEFTRVAKAFHLDSMAEAVERVQDTVEPFYTRALKSTRTKLGTDQVSSRMLERARTTLGITDPATVQDLHVGCFNAQVQAELGLAANESSNADGGGDDSGGDDTASAATPKLDDDLEASLKKAKFADDSMERLNQLAEILGLSETDAEYEITLEVTPLYQSTALQALNMVLANAKTPEEAWSIMEARREELLLQEDNSKTLLSSMVMQALGGPLEATNKFAKVNNEAATYDNMLEALEAKKTLISILAKSGWDEFDNFDEKFCNPWDRQSANGFLNSDERIKLYKIFMTRSIRKAENGKLTDEMYARIDQVKGLLGITDQQAEVETRAAFGPYLQKVLHKAMEEIVADYTPELAKNMKTETEQVLENYHLTADYLREMGAGFYNTAVGKVADQAPNGIPTEELSQSLEALRDLFGLETEDCYPMHLEAFGQVYKKSVLEAMGSTGIIKPDFRESLETLQVRLGVSEESCRVLFLEAIEEKMKPMVEWVGSEMERTMLSQKQLAQRRGKDVGEDVFQTGKGADGVLGLGAEVNTMSDIMELVDFYNENEVSHEEKRTKSVEEEVDGEMQTKEETYMETMYPVTALDSGAIDNEMAELLYRQFTVGGFTTQGDQGARYEASRETFGGILGLEESKMNEIKDNIGSTVYDNFITNAMKTKGAMDQQDMMFLANIQGKLGLTSEQGEKMMAESQKKILSEEIEVIMDDPAPGKLKAFRERCNMMGMDLKDDVGISSVRLSRMFESEIVPGLKDGTVTAEDSDILGEIQESLGMPEEDCENMFASVLEKLSKSAFQLIQGEIMRGREENCVDLLKELVRYAAFVEGDLGLQVEESLGNQIYNIYESFDFDGEDADVIEANKGLLKETMGLA